MRDNWDAISEMDEDAVELVDASSTAGIGNVMAAQGGSDDDDSDDDDYDGDGSDGGDPNTPTSSVASKAKL